MTNHLHLLITPEDKTQLTKFMQSLANRYVRYFNAKYRRTGTIWEGRFKSCLVDSDDYLFTLYKYIEMNPVKAGMVKDIADYKWSSYPYNALNEEDNLITVHNLYQGLGVAVGQRKKRYKELFSSLDIENQERQITSATMRGEVFGSDNFHRKIEVLISRTTKLTSHGGDRKSGKHNNQVG